MSGNVFITLKWDELEVWNCIYCNQVGSIGGLRLKNNTQVGRVGGQGMCLCHLGGTSKRSGNVFITLWWEESEGEN